MIIKVHCEPNRHSHVHLASRYYDGKRLQESSDEYMISQQKQLLTLFSLEAGNHTVICKLINGNASISNRLQLYAAGKLDN